jgi:S-adenosylmethionine hydrolase
MSKRRLVIITDCSDIASNELRGVILKAFLENNFTEDIDIEPMVFIKPFSIINGAFVLRLMAESYPPETIFLIILNPMKERPERIIGKTSKSNFIFAGANTGVFSWFLKDFGIEKLYELHDPGFLPFGGKNVFVPSVVKFILNKSFEEIATPFDVIKLANLNLEDGTIVHIDNFGLIKFLGKIPESKEGDKFKIKIGINEFDAIYAKRMMNYETGDWVIYPGSSLGLPEIGIVRDNGAQKLGVNIGDKVIFYKE